MKKKVLILILSFLFIGANLYAGDGDLIVNGQLGVGTTSPDTKFHVFSGDASQTGHANIQLVVENSATAGINILSGANSTGYLLFGDSGLADAGSIAYNHSADSMLFTTARADRMLIDNNGNVGIGTTSPSRKLQVAGDVRVGNTVSLSQTAPLDVIAHSGNTIFQAWDDNDLNTPRFIVKRTGNVGIGTTNPGAKLDVAGTVKATGLGRSNCAWTDWFRRESGNSPQYAPSGAYIAGIDYQSTTGGADGQIRFYYCFPGN